MQSRPHFVQPVKKRAKVEPKMMKGNSMPPLLAKKPLPMCTVKMAVIMTIDSRSAKSLVKAPNNMAIPPKNSVNDTI